MYICITYIDDLRDDNVVELGINKCTKQQPKLQCCVIILLWLLFTYFSPLLEDSTL